MSSPMISTYSPATTTFIPAGGVMYPAAATTFAPYEAHDRSVNLNEQKYLTKVHKQETKRAQKNAKIANKDLVKSEKLYAKAAELASRGKEDRAIKKQDKAAQLAAAAQVHQTASSIALLEANRNSSLIGLPGYGYGSRSLLITPSRSFLPSSSIPMGYNAPYGYTTGPILAYTTVSPPVMMSSPVVSAPIQQYIYYNTPATKDLSFADLRQIFAKYTTTMPKGALGRLFGLVANDTKGRLSEATFASIDNDLSSLVADFRKIDENNNNTLSRKEFRQYYKAMGFEKKSVIDALYRVADEDGSESVGFNEYVHLALCILVLRLLFNISMNKDNINNAEQLTNKDNNGQLAKEDVRKILLDTELSEITTKKFDDVFNFVDSDNSGTLNYFEFVRLVLLLVVD